MYDVAHMMAKTGLSWRDLETLEAQGAFPARSNPHATFYPAADVDAWIAANPTPPLIGPEVGDVKLIGSSLAVWTFFGWAFVPLATVRALLEQLDEGSK